MNTDRIVNAKPINPAELESDFWRTNAQNYLKDALNDPRKTDPKPEKAKNIILFLGDGMSLATVAATRVYIGGEEKSLSFEKFTHFGLSKVCTLHMQWKREIKIHCIIIRKLIVFSDILR